MQVLVSDHELATKTLDRSKLLCTQLIAIANCGQGSNLYCSNIASHMHEINNHAEIYLNHVNADEAEQAKSMDCYKIKETNDNKYNLEADFGHTTYEAHPLVRLYCALLCLYSNFFKLPSKRELSHPFSYFNMSKYLSWYRSKGEFNMERREFCGEVVANIATYIYYITIHGRNGHQQEVVERRKSAMKRINRDSRAVCAVVRKFADIKFQIMLLSFLY